MENKINMNIINVIDSEINSDVIYNVGKEEFIKLFNNKDTIISKEPQGLNSQQGIKFRKIYAYLSEDGKEEAKEAYENLMEVEKKKYPESRYIGTIDNITYIYTGDLEE